MIHQKIPSIKLCYIYNSGFIILYSNFIYFIFKSIFLLYIKNTNSKNILFSFSRLKCILMIYQKVSSIILYHIYTSNFIILYLSLYLVSIYFYFYLTFFITKALYIYIYLSISLTNQILWYTR